MKHIGRVSVIPSSPAARRKIGRADAIIDLWNGLWRVWSDFVYQKKNEISV